MDPSLHIPHDELAAICRAHGVKSLDLFGSATTAAFDASRSDIDLLVEFIDPDLGPWMKRLFDLREDLEHLFGRTVDLTLHASLAKPLFRESVEATKVPLYAAA